MSFPADGKNVRDVSDTMGKQIGLLAADTLQKLHEIIIESPELMKHGRKSLFGGMFNDSIVFIQFIEIMCSLYKHTTAGAFQQACQDADLK